MEPERRQKVLLGLLVVVLAAAGVYWSFSGPADYAPSASNVRAAGRTAAGGGVTAPDVHLKSLQSERPRPGGSDRNLFRFKPKTAATVERPPPSEAVEPPPSDGPPPPPSAAPIALKFLGVMESPERALRVAVLSDGRGIYRGREGDIIEGRYRIVRIGAESIEMTHLDGTGRQLIRLTGS